MVMGPGLNTLNTFIKQTFTKIGNLRRLRNSMSNAMNVKHYISPIWIYCLYRVDLNYNSFYAILDPAISSLHHIMIKLYVKVNACDI